MNKENEAKIAKARREMERINAEWEVLNKECKRMIYAMTGMNMQDPDYSRLLEMVEITQEKRRAIGDRHMIAMGEWLMATNERLLEVREGGDLSTESTEGTEGR